MPEHFCSGMKWGEDLSPNLLFQMDAKAKNPDGCTLLHL